LKIERFFFQKKRIVLKFADVDSIETAETLRDTEVCVDETRQSNSKKMNTSIWELEGCAVETIEGEKVGTVRELMRTAGLKC
jgi:ribosomal 30S subunit maturation factor RimM